LEVSKAVGLPLEEFHLGVETLGDSVVAREAPHGDDLLGPGGQGLAELNQGSQACLPKFVDGAQQPGDQCLALLTSAVFFEQ